MLPESIARLLIPYLSEPPSETLCRQLSTYLDLLLKWNSRTNLTAIRDPEDIIRRHFGESLFAARHLPSHTQALLDLGSGAGFPGLPIQLLLPPLTVMLAESQHKKASFLREVIRTLQLPTQVHAARAETLPANHLFDVVTLRAVDNMAAALEAAVPRVRPGGHLLLLASEKIPDLAAYAPSAQATYPIPGALRSLLYSVRF